MFTSEAIVYWRAVPDRLKPEKSLMKTTPLHARHIELGAKMAPFGGFDMPIQYEGILAEHAATRNAATFFDTCHMGEFKVSGVDACSDLDRIFSSDIAGIEPGQCRYGFICNESGGVIDDEITYRMGPEEFFIVVNAGTQDDDFAWIRSRLSPGTAIENLSATTAKLDLQGPKSARIMQSLMEKSIDNMRYYRWQHNRYRGERILTSRTGYTGEMGFELYVPPALVVALWDDIIARGAKPAGLGARDILRLEMGYPLYGHELSASRNAAESGFTRAINTAKSFIGSEVVCDPVQANARLAGIRLDGRRAARQADTILNSDGIEIGTITSGSFSPSVNAAVAMGYIRASDCAPGTNVTIRSDRADLSGTVSTVPFYNCATARKPLKDFL